VKSKTVSSTLRIGHRLWPAADRSRARSLQLARAERGGTSLARASHSRSVLRKPTLGRARDLLTAPESVSRACAQMRTPRLPSWRESLYAAAERRSKAAVRRPPLVKGVLLRECPQLGATPRRLGMAAAKAGRPRAASWPAAHAARSPIELEGMAAAGSRPRARCELASSARSCAGSARCALADRAHSGAAAAGRSVSKRGHPPARRHAAPPHAH
jgi:hypothetical protein